MKSAQYAELLAALCCSVPQPTHLTASGAELGDDHAKCQAYRLCRHARQFALLRDAAYFTIIDLRSSLSTTSSSEVFTRDNSVDPAETDSRQVLRFQSCEAGGMAGFTGASRGSQSSGAQ